MRAAKGELDDDENNYSIPTSLARDYENKWVFTSRKETF